MKIDRDTLIVLTIIIIPFLVAAAWKFLPLWLCIPTTMALWWPFYGAMRRCKDELK